MKLKRREVRQFLEDIWDVDLGGFTLIGGKLTVDLIDTTAAQVRVDLDSFLATLDRPIDPDSITIIDDQMDDSTVSIARVTFEVTP